MKTKNPQIIELKNRLLEVSYLNSTQALSNWDQEVNMPSKGSDARAKACSYLSAIIHNKFLDIDKDGLLSKLKSEVDKKEIKGGDAVIVNETWRSFNREKKLPEEFVRRYTEITSKSQQVWALARSKNDFKMFLPWLRKIVDLKKEEAKFVGFENTPYDALLDTYEPGMKSGDVEKVLSDLKSFLIPLVAKIAKSKVKINSKKVLGKFPLDKQIAFNQFLAGEIGFDFDRGRLDKSTHPFTTSFHPDDVRITTRYKNDELFHAIGSTIHETGHALYEQGLVGEHFGTALGEYVSMGIHESQSRMWENNIGKSKAFWKHLYQKLQKEFPVPFKKVLLDEFYKIINISKPSFIRTESDEVTYNLHIIVRFEIEKAMVEGKIDPKDAPKVWKQKMKEYFGLEVKNDTEGILQDVHWSCGLIGYFPTYTLGNLYAAQFYNTLKKQITDLEKKIEKGNFADILTWLRKEIHVHGKTYLAKDLVKKVTGEELSAKYFKEYLEKKYKEIYDLD